MARYSLNVLSQTPAVTAGGGTATTVKYMGLLGGTSTQYLRVNEVQAGGEATSGAVIIYRMARASTNSATNSLSAGATNTLMDAVSTAPATAPAAFNTSTSPGVISASLVVIRHSFNAYGGLVRWQARQGEEITAYGTAVNLGELDYLGDTGCSTSATISAHIIYEAV